jgi:predicted transcriptional regulator
MAKDNVPLRLDPSVTARVDEIARMMSRVAGVEVSRAAALRACVNAGILAEEKRLRIAPPEKEEKPAGKPKK